MDIPEPRYAKSGDVHIAYRVHGDGPFDIVAVPPWFWSLDTFGYEPGEVAALDELSSIGRVIVFDKRGSGSSDPILGAPTLEERMDDVRSVMDAVGSSCAALLGVGVDGGAMSMLFAATYPERTFALALLGALPRVAWAPDYDWGMRRLEYEEKTQDDLRHRLQGSTPENVRARAATAGENVNSEEASQLSRLYRVGVSPGTMLAYREMNFDIDVRPVLPTISAPTLLMYSEERVSLLSPTQQVAEYMRARIPRSEVVAVPFNSNWARVAHSALRDFLPRTWDERPLEPSEPVRVLATVLFTDIVDSTRRASELGPRWQDLLREHNVVIRRQLARFEGREIDTAGDGFFASGFDGPARAIRCACAIRDVVTALGLGVRVGVHTGECDIVEDKLSGLAVNIGARVASQADEGEVLVSGTVKDLVAGSGITFRPRGVRELKGLGEWPLYAVTA